MISKENSIKNDGSGRGAILLLTLLAFVLSTSSLAHATIVGAIRWDGWNGSNTLWSDNLAPSAGYQDRRPWGACRNSPPWVDESRLSIDYELQWMAGSKLNYWAFVLYAFDPTYRYALDYYLSSPYRANINFTVILEQINNPPTNSWWTVGAGVRDGLLAAMATHPQWQKVTVAGVTRPLLYVNNPQSITDNQFCGSWFWLENLRANTNAYIVALIGGTADPGLGPNCHSPGGVDNCIAGKFDAISIYATVDGGVCSSSNIPGDSCATPLAYGDLAAWAQTMPWYLSALYNSTQNRNWQIVPTAMAGWNPSPRYSMADPWHPGQNMWQTTYWWSHRYNAGSGQEIANHIKAIRDFTSSHSTNQNPDNAQRTEADTVLVYAWNEFDEGGWLSPTCVGNPVLNYNWDILSAINGTL